jgi:hypothetical protein
VSYRVGVVGIWLLGALLSAPPERVLVLDFSDLDTGLSELATARAAEELGRRGVPAVSEREARELLEVQTSAQKLACEDAECVAQLIEVSHAPVLVYGAVGRVGKSWLVTVSARDRRGSSAIRTASRTFDADSDELDQRVDAAVREALAEIFAWPGGAAPQSYRLPKGPVSYAVFGIRSAGIAANSIDSLVPIVAAELRKLDGVSVIAREDIESMLALESERSRIDCADSTGCLAELGGALGVQKLVTGTIGRVGELFVVSLQQIDVGHVRVDNRVTEVFAGSEEQLVGAARLAVRRLAGVEALGAGALVVESNVAALLLVDDRAAQSPLRGLEPGKHRLRLSSDGHVGWSSDVYVEPESETLVRVELEALPSWYEHWWVWAGAGVAVLGGAAAWWALQDDDESRTFSTSAPPLPQ